ncbi:hypothetical protein EON79_20240, partial [bacterium]
MMPFFALPALASTLRIVSPDERIAATLDLSEGKPSLSVAFQGRTLLAPGALGIDFADSGPLASGLRVTGVRESQRDSTWKSLTGKTSRVRDHYREATVALQEEKAPRRRLEIVVRAYDDGVAFRYRIPKQAGWTDLAVREELTEFRPTGNPKAYALVLPNERTPYEEPYQTAPLRDLKEGALIGLPLMLSYVDGTALAFTEADLTDYPGIYLRPTGGVLKGHLSPRLDDSGLAVRGKLPKATPWRVLMVSDAPGKLIESNLVLNLNPPSVLKDTSWIRPGKTAFPWWNGYNTGDTGIAPAQTTEYHKWCIDFCAKHGIPYHSIDGLDNVAWYGGPIMPYGGGPITAGLPGLDVPEVLRYAKSKGVRIRVWMSSAAAKAQMATAYP